MSYMNDWFVKRHGWRRTDVFGAHQQWRKDAGFGPHTGTDYFHPARAGHPIYSPVNGVVNHAGSTGGSGGIWLRIRTPSGVEFVVAHISRARVKAGDVVKVGDHIADNGRTGSATDDHAHVEVRVNGRHVDPEKHVFAAADIQTHSTKFKAGDWIATRGRDLNLREKPGTNHPSLRTLDSGTVLQVQAHKDNGILATGHNWWFVGDGWLAETYLESTKPPKTELELAHEEIDRLKKELANRDKTVSELQGKIKKAQDALK